MDTSNWRDIVAHLTEYGWILGVLVVLFAALRWGRPRKRPLSTPQTDGAGDTEAKHDPAEVARSRPTRPSTTSAASFSQLRNTLEDASAQLGEGTISTHTDSRIEWHGQCQDVALHLHCERTSGNWLLQMESEVVNPHGLLGLHWDPDRGPDTTLNERPRADESVRVYVAPNTFLEGVSEDLEEELACLNGLPQTLMAEVMKFMAVHQLSYWHFHETRVALGFRERHLNSPEVVGQPVTVTQLVDVATRLARFTVELARAPVTPPPAAPSKPGLGDVSSCAGCSRRCLASEEGACRNCGRRLA